MDLRALPRVADSWGFLYLEQCRIDQDAKAIAAHDEHGKVAVPCASLTTLLVGPGTSITHAAIRTLADNGCLVLWTGEQGVRFYAQGMGETRSARNLIRQAALASDPGHRLRIVRRLYELRFPEPLPPGLTLQQVRGREGVRVRDAYARASRETGVPWHGRAYRRNDWSAADPVNRALSTANSALYGICHAAIVSAGYSPALGFIHTGKMLSFVYDVADLYKIELTVPLAFTAAVEGASGLEGRVRRACRDAFHTGRLLQRIVPDLQRLLGREGEEDDAYDRDAALPGGLWDPELGEVAGGINRADGEASDDAPEHGVPEEPEWS